MTSDQYQELAEFVAGKFDSMDAQFDQLRVETRTYVEVSTESLRGDLRALAEKVSANGERIEENGRRIEAVGGRVDALARRFDAADIEGS